MPQALICDCCGLPVDPRAGKYCARCHYPVDRAKEKQFLEISLRDLRRVAAHGGESLTVGNLIFRYQRRLDSLNQLDLAPAVAPVSIPQGTPSAVVAVPVPAALPARPEERPVSVPAVASTVAETVSPRPVPAAAPPVQKAPRKPFSLAAFLSNQAINIVASLGAFLILIGALGLIATTNDLWRSFLIVFGAQAIFGVVGVIAYRFRTLRVVALIYTIIFALLVPLVGFSAYRLVQGHLIALSPWTLIALSALYAAVVYALLAIYQRFAFFGYLGTVSLLVADLATAGAFSLSYWWWPTAAMLLTFPALVFVTPFAAPAGPAKPAPVSLEIVREPICNIMYLIAASGVASTLFIGIYSAQLDTMNSPQRDVRFSLLSLVLLLLFWVGLFIWRSRRTMEILALAFFLLFLASALSFAYAFDSAVAGYALVMIGVALCYHGLAVFGTRFLRRFGALSLRLDQLAVVLVGVVLAITSYLLPFQLLSRAYSPASLRVELNWQAFAIWASLLVGFALTLSIIIRRAGMTTAPDGRSNRWPWLLLFGGVLFNGLYGQMVLLVNAEPVWSFLSLTLALLVGTVFVRQRYGIFWANPLDIVVLGGMFITLSLGLNSSQELPGVFDRVSGILLLFAALTYGVTLYQRRWRWLFLPLVFALPAGLLLSFWRLQVILLVGLLLPLAAAGVHRFLPAQSSPVGSNAGTRPQRGILWAWPLFSIGLIYGVALVIHDIFAPTGTIEGWLNLSFPRPLEIAGLALFWYVAAWIARVKLWQLPVVGFAAVALLFPSNLFWVLVWIPPVAALLAVVISRLSDRAWSLPLYAVALLAAIMAGYAGLVQEHHVAVTWALLGFSVLAYAVGVVENLPVALWLAPIFATGSIFFSVALSGDMYRPPIMVLICAASGVAIGCIRFLPALSARLTRKHVLIEYALPFYATALAAAVLTGIYGALFGINTPFYGAVPDALLAYAVVAFAVLFFENRPRWLALVALFAIWGLLLAIETTAYYPAAIGFGAGLIGLAIGRIASRPPSSSLALKSLRAVALYAWSWPWYATALVAAIVTGLWPAFPVLQPGPGFIEYCLLGFAVLGYGIGLVEGMLSWLWVGPVFAAWSLIYAEGDLYRQVAAALVCTAAGVGIRLLYHFVPALRNTRQRQATLWYALPLYATAFVAAVLAGVQGVISGIQAPFYGAIPDLLLLYAVIAFGVTRFERRPGALLLTAGFAIWALLLAIQASAYYVFVIGIGAGLTGILAGRIFKQPVADRTRSPYWQALARFTWSWPWYVTALCAALVIASWELLPVPQPVAGFTWYSLLAFAALSLLVMIVERQPEILVIPIALAAWAIGIAHWASWQAVLAYNGLFVLAFATRYIWKFLSPATSWLPAEYLPAILGLSGQFIVVCVVIGMGGFFAASGLLAHTGAGSLLVLALLLLWFGWSQDRRALRDACSFGAGLLLSLVISWELSVFQQTRADLLTLAPAGYLSLVAAFLMRDEALPEHRIVGQLTAIAGAALLLLPPLLMSFGAQDTLLATLILLSESLGIMILGIVTRVRVFFLAGTGLLVVGGLRALFLPALNIPLPLILMVLGGTLIAVATGLVLARHRLQILLHQWE